MRILNRRTRKREDVAQSSEERRHTRKGKNLCNDGFPARPIVVIDPRAGHGPGIGGSKLNSQIGVALDYGHPVYFITFSTEPEPGQTISSVHKAEIRFLEEVVKRHPDAPKPAVIGNCQAGWATALIGADRPDLTGPMVFNGSPISYWGGVEGTHPMRYKGGLTGGLWLTSFMSDLGNDKFDGALEKTRLQKEAAKGGFVEASVRVMIMIIGADKILDMREFQVAEDIIHECKRLSKITPEQFKQIVREQARILNGVPRKALTSIKQLLTTAEDKKKVYAMAERLAHADTILAENEKGLLEILKRILS